MFASRPDGKPPPTRLPRRYELRHVEHFPSVRQGRPAPLTGE
jgi:hypothetical protein